MAEVYDSVTDGLKALYKSKIRPVEEAYKFGEFYSPIMNDGDFDAKPMVLLIGQYSVGKTSFIRYLLGRDFPGQHIGPEPTTDRFIAVMHGQEDKTTPGNALAVSPNMPFRGLEMFGNGFLSKFQGAQLDVPLLNHVTLIDTPGILSGEKQRIGRTYEFTHVIEWFSARCDVILLLFDAHKLDISDEFKNAIECLKGQDDKIRVVLNKADQVDAQKLIRIYGALMWSLGKVVKTPECVRVYIGSFWDQPLNCGEWSRELLQREMADLLNDLKNVPKNAAVRKVNELVKRVRLSKAHAYIIGHLKKEMPAMFGKEKAQAKALASLEEHFLKVHRAHHLPVGDFPDVAKFRGCMEGHDLSKFPKLDTKLIDSMDTVLSRDLPKLMAMFPQEGTNQPSQSAMADSISHVGANLASTQISQPPPQIGYSAPPAPPPAAPPQQYAQPYPPQNNPYAAPPPPGPSPFDAPAPAAWAITSDDKTRYDEVFGSLNPTNGLVSGAAVRPVLERSNLPVDVLRNVWNLSDIDRDGCLDADEFAVAMHLARESTSGKTLPTILPIELIPPSKR